MYEGYFKNFVTQPFSACGNTVSGNSVHILLKIFKAHVQNFIAISLKLHDEEENNDGSNTDGCASDVKSIATVDTCTIDVWQGIWRCTHAKLAPQTPHPLAQDRHNGPAL